MTSNIISVNKTQSIKEVSELLDNNNIHHMPVMSGDALIGMLSRTDLEKISFVNSMEGEGLTTAMYDVLSIEQVMTKNLSVVQASDTIHDVAVTLSKNEFHALPVLDGEKVTGIVTTTDLIKYLIDQY